MKYMTYDEMIEIIKAEKEGKKIQFQSTIGSGSKWTDRNRFAQFDFVDYNYRVKPEDPLIQKELYFTDTGLCFTDEQRVKDYVKTARVGYKTYVEKK